MDIVDKVYEKYNLPIWITEMSVVDNEAETADENRYTSSQILATMRKLLPELYNRKYVERFAWFSATKDSPNYPRQAASILFDEYLYTSSTSIKFVEHFEKIAKSIITKTNVGSDIFVMVCERVLTLM